MPTLVLVRHGESQWNQENRFTGWVDVPLASTGVSEAVEAGKNLKARGYGFDVVHTSLLKRAIRTSQIMLEEMDMMYLPVKRHWRLNERHYGALQGLDKKETAQKHGEDQVFAWRRSYATPPPPMALDDPLHPANDARYKRLPKDVVPSCECLKDVVERVLPYWHDHIVPDLRDGKRVLVAAHGNSLRALVKHLDGISDDEIAKLNIPTAVPFVIELDDDLNKVKSFYLADEETVKAKQHAVANQGKA